MADELLSPEDAIDRFVVRFNEELSAGVKLLIEEKHLYQKTKIDVLKIKDEMLQRVATQDERRWVAIQLDSRLTGPITLMRNDSFKVVGRGDPRFQIFLNVPIVRLFCETCRRKEAFAPQSYREIAGETPFSLFVITYECQYCKGAPVGILIRKTDWTFSLDGRSPMEHIELPQYIPRNEAHLFRDGIIGAHTGKWLAAVFYLRCFIEQFARRQAEMKKARKTGDEIMDAYVQKLPADKRSHLPSFKEWYDRLSEPIHAADAEEAEKLFDTARARIENHFEIRQALRIPEE
jgi:hypothetical protein